VKTHAQKYFQKVAKQTGANKGSVGTEASSPASVTWAAGSRDATLEGSRGAEDSLPNSPDGV
jgi:hypothetical protein